MPRNAEVIRQWKLLLHLDGLAHGRSVDELAAELRVNKRTVWRDLYSDGGLYLRAFVPEYDEVRLFAVERIRTIRVTEQSFTPIKPQKDDDFEPSLGLGNGKPERVVLEFSLGAARLGLELGPARARDRAVHACP